LKILQFGASVLTALVIAALEMVLARGIFDHIKGLLGSILYYLVPVLIGIVFPSLAIRYSGRVNRYIMASSMATIMLTVITLLVLLVSI